MMEIQDFEIIVPLKYLSNFWITLEMPLINCEVNLILTWSKDNKIMQNYFNNENLVLEEQLTGTNMNQT